MAKDRSRSDDANDRYLELVRRFPLRPLRSEAELDRAIEIVDSLVDLVEPSQEESDYLDVLGDLVEKYETEHHPMPPVPNDVMLRNLIEMRGISLTALTAKTGVATSTISQLLRGKRALNVRHIDAFARYFHVSPAVFIGPKKNLAAKVKAQSAGRSKSTPGLSR